MGYRRARLPAFDLPGAFPAGLAPFSDSPIALVPAQRLPICHFCRTYFVPMSGAAAVACYHAGIFVLATSGILLVLGQPATFAISLVIIGCYLFFRGRFLPLGAVLLVLSLAVKPQIGGLIVLYLLAQRIHWRYAAVALACPLALLLSAGLVLTLHPRSADWTSTLRANLSATLSPGGSADPRPANVEAVGDPNLQTLTSIFFADARIFNAAAYAIFLILLAALTIVVLRANAGQELHFLALAAVSASR